MALPQVIIAIVLSSTIIASTVSYIPIETMLSNQTHSVMNQSLSQLESGWEDYVEDNRTYSAVCKGEPVNGECIDHKLAVNDLGFPDSGTWQSDLIPQYLATPAVSRDYDISYGASSDNAPYTHYFCLKGTLSDYTYRAIQKLKNHHPDAKITVNSGCGSNTVSYPSNGAEFALTYWVRYTDS